MNSSPTTDSSRHRELSRRFLKALRTHITGLQHDLFELLEDLDEVQQRHTPFWRCTRRRSHDPDRPRWNGTVGRDPTCHDSFS